MQTFLPYVSFARCAAVLDNKRLGKQRVETLQIMNALTRGVGWVNHPATKMWAGHERALLSYQVAICDEWSHTRGFKDTCLDKTQEVWKIDRLGEDSGMPEWLGDRRVHLTHRANLLRKDPEHYGQFGWAVKPREGYYWPV